MYSTVLNWIAMASSLSGMVSSKNALTNDFSSRISVWNFLNFIGFSVNNPIGEGMESTIESYEKHAKHQDQLSMDDNIRVNMKWGMRGIAILFLPAIIGILPLLEKNLLETFSGKGKRAFSVGYGMENRTKNLYFLWGS